MSNYHFKERDMSLKAKGLLSLMLSLPDDWNYNLAGLVKLSKDGKDGVMSALGELEKFGYLKRVRTQDTKGRFTGIEYHIFEQPQPDLPVADNTKAGNPNSDKGNSANQNLLNTNIKLNTNNNKNTKELSTKSIALEDAIEVLEVIKDNELKNLYIDYIEARRIMKAPLTPRGLEMLMTRCERLANFDINVQKALLETAIINNWRNVYAPKEEEMRGRNGKLDELRKFYSEDE
jgi:hypothetical protein